MYMGINFMFINWWYTFIISCMVKQTSTQPKENFMSHQNLLSKIDIFKAEIDQCRPFTQYMQQQINDHYRIHLTYTSNALEGNSLTEPETKTVLDEGIAIGGKTLKEHFEAVGNNDACSLIFALATKKTITEQNILDLHRLFYRHIDPDNAGIYRQQPALISGTDTKLPPPSKIPQLMQALVANIPQLQKEHHPVEYAALLHLKLVQIRPFIDGNGRTARLLMNLALLQAGYFIVIIPPVIRHEYGVSIRATLAEGHSPFVLFIAQMEYESGKDYQRMIKHLMTH
jgi:Fic family protein